MHPTLANILRIGPADGRETTLARLHATQQALVTLPVADLHSDLHRLLCTEVRVLHLRLTRTTGQGRPHLLPET